MITMNGPPGGVHNRQFQFRYPSGNVQLHQQMQPQHVLTDSNQSMAAMTGYLGHPNTYANFGTTLAGAPIHGTLALIVIPPGLNPQAAIAAGCQMLICGTCPPQVLNHPHYESSNMVQELPAPMLLNYQTQQQRHMESQENSMVIQPNGYIFIDNSGSSQISSPTSGVQLNPHAETFIPRNSSRPPPTGKLERGSGDSRRDPMAVSNGAESGEKVVMGITSTGNRISSPMRERDNFVNSEEHVNVNGSSEEETTVELKRVSTPNDVKNAPDVVQLVATDSGIGLASPKQNSTRLETIWSGVPRVVDKLENSVNPQLLKRATADSGICGSGSLPPASVKGNSVSTSTCFETVVDVKNCPNGHVDKFKSSDSVVHGQTNSSRLENTGDMAVAVDHDDGIWQTASRSGRIRHGSIRQRGRRGYP